MERHVEDTRADGRSAVVDVGIPTHRRPAYLEFAVRSVLSQTFDAWNLVVSEDGPASQAVARVMREFASDPRVQLIATGAPVGPAANMTGLLGQGRGRYIAVLHDDDLWEPEFLERRVAFMDAHPECGFVFAADIDVDHDGRPLSAPRYVTSEGVHRPDDFVPILLDHNVVSPPTLLLRRSACEAVGAFYDGRFRTIYDYELVLRLAIRFPVGYLRIRDAAWRRHGQQSSSKNYEREAEYEQFLAHVDDLLRIERPQLRMTSRQRRERLASWLRYMAFNAIEQGDRRSGISQLRRAISLSPGAALDPRVVAAVAATVLGGPGRLLLGRSRTMARRWRYARG